MSHDAISNWVENAKLANRSHVTPASQGVQVVRASQAKSGNIILELSEKFLPVLSKLLDGVRDMDGLLLQPAHVRALSLELAQNLVKKYNA